VGPAAVDHLRTKEPRGVIVLIMAILVGPGDRSSQFDAATVPSDLHIRYLKNQRTNQA
jgi:hypothetical protein